MPPGLALPAAVFLQRQMRIQMWVSTSGSHENLFCDLTVRIPSVAGSLAGLINFRSSASMKKTFGENGQLKSSSTAYTWLEQVRKRSK